MRFCIAVCVLLYYVPVDLRFGPWVVNAATIHQGLSTSSFLKDPVGRRKIVKKSKLTMEYRRSVLRHIRSIRAYDDCELAPWSSWMPCSVTCGEGSNNRVRQWLTPVEMREAAECLEEPLHQSKPCNGPPCPPDEVKAEDDCSMEPWSPWGQCSVTCGKGERKRQRERRIKLLDRCDVDTEVETYNCILEACPRDCVVSEWSNWSLCNSTCGDGHRERIRSKLSEAEEGGRSCHRFELKEESTCEVVDCKRCQIAPWEHWSECSSTCGKGFQTRQRKLMEVEDDACEGVRTEHKRDCLDTVHCEPCKLTSWREWGHCSVSCGGGVRTRLREVLKEAYDYACKHNNTEGTQDCNQFACGTSNVNNDSPNKSAQRYLPLSMALSISFLVIVAVT